MKITLGQLKKLIREQVEEMSHMGGAMEGRRGRAAEEAEKTVYTPDDLRKLARSDVNQLLNIGRQAYGSEPQEAFIKFPSGRQEEIAAVTIDQDGYVRVDFVNLNLDSIKFSPDSAKRRR